MAASVPVLLLAGVLSWQRDVLCTQSGCGTVAASAWTGSPVWAVVLAVALALGGVWVLLPPTRGRVPLGVAALTGVAGVVSAAIVVVSLDALVFNQAGFFGFDLPVTETFPVLAVHPGPGLLLGLLGLLLQAAGGWTSVRHRTALLTTPRRHQARPSTSPGRPPPRPQPSPARALPRPRPSPGRPLSRPPPSRGRPPGGRRRPAHRPRSRGRRPLRPATRGRQPPRRRAPVPSQPGGRGTRPPPSHGRPPRRRPVSRRLVHRPRSRGRRWRSDRGRRRRGGTVGAADE